MKPLAYKLRPTSFDDIVGQDHLVGKNGVIRKMLEQNKLFSMILYGPPGTGKTSIAMIIGSFFPLNVFEYNASVDNKQKLKEIADATNYYENVLVIIDEMHRLKKDVQDFLLPFLESGKLILVGLTTSNPYNSINPAIRSRCHIYKLKEITKDDIISILRASWDKEYAPRYISIDILDFIASASGLEIRTALNMLEAVSLLDDGDLSLKSAEEIVGKKALRLDGKEEYYYDLLSAFIKSIRGSDVDASILYLGRLLMIGDLEIICRRILISAYEDVGLANVGIGSRVLAACETALKVGMPEARIPLSVAVIDLALSPKSNSAYLAIDKALSDIENKDSLPIPINILNKEIKGNSKLYKYPHDYPDGFVLQQYLPTGMTDVKYYIPKETGNYERALKERFEILEKRKIK